MTSFSKFRVYSFNHWYQNESLSRFLSVHRSKVNSKAQSSPVSVELVLQASRLLDVLLPLTKIAVLVEHDVYAWNTSSSC